MKKLTIKHDGKLTVTGYGTVNLGDCPLHSVISAAMDLGIDDYKECFADVTIEIKLKPNVPTARWDEC